MAKYILIKDNFVANVIVADADFVKAIEKDYDAVIDWDSHPANPNVGDTATELIKGNWYFKPRFYEVEEDYIDAEEVKPTAAIEAPIEAVEPPAGD